MAAGELMNEERIIDYRPEQETDIPVACPVCGMTIEREAVRGSVTVSGPADRAFAARYGIDGDGPAETIWWRWWCPNAPDHPAGPTLLATRP